VSPARKHVVIVRLELDEAQWASLQRAAIYHNESVREVVITEARLGVENEIALVDQGAREIGDRG
jgi:hypothetical protein